MTSKRILVVEDDPKSLYAMKAVLEHYGHQVTAFNSPTQARELDIAVIDTALIDLRLPDMSGGELARQLKRKKSNLQVILMTAYSREVVDGDLAGFPLLVKPLDMGQVLKMV